MTEPSGITSVGVRIALEALEFRAKLHAYLYRLVRNSADADELLQDVLTRLLRVGNSDHTAVADVRAFVFTMARNAAFDWLRRQGAMPCDLTAHIERLTEPDNGADLEWQLDAGYELGRLSGVLESLPPGYREVFLLIKVEGYTPREVAELRGTAEKTVRNQLAMAMFRCKAALFPRDADRESMLFGWFHRLARRRKKGRVR